MPPTPHGGACGIFMLFCLLILPTTSGKTFQCSQKVNHDEPITCRGRSVVTYSYQGTPDSGVKPTNPESTMDIKAFAGWLFYNSIGCFGDPYPHAGCSYPATEDVDSVTVIKGGHTSRPDWAKTYAMGRQSDTPVLTRWQVSWLGATRTNISLTGYIDPYANYILCQIDVDDIALEYDVSCTC